MLIFGSCHCANISFTLNWEPEPSEIPARTCTCSFCIKHVGVWTSCPTGSLRVSVRDQAQVSKYAFGTKTARFHICRTCGIVPIVTSRIEGRIYAVVNTNTFDNVPATLLRRSSATFEEETGEVRLARRKQGWIANVEFSETGN
ncbi:MAG: hypothetical protein WB784_01415 [Rhodanobacteraceae bacterium]